MAPSDDGMAVHVEDTDTLVTSAAGGDDRAWSALVERFSRLVWSVARAHGLADADAEEVFQTTWLRLTEHIGRLKEPQRLGAWLATTARNESLKIIRAGGRLTVTDDQHLLDRPSDLDSPERAALDAEDAATRTQRLRRVWSAFQQLPRRCQQLLRMLIATPPLSYTEIAAVMEIAVGSVGPTRARCLGQLRELLAEVEAHG